MVVAETQASEVFNAHSCRMEDSMVTCCATVQLIPYSGVCPAIPININVQTPFTKGSKLAPIVEACAAKIRTHLHNTCAMQEKMFKVSDDLFLVVHLDVTVVAGGKSLTRAVFQVVHETLENLRIPEIREVTHEGEPIVVKLKKFHRILSDAQLLDTSYRLRTWDEEIANDDEDSARAPAISMVLNGSDSKARFSHLSVSRRIDRDKLLPIVRDLQA